MTNRELFAKQLKEARESLGISQEKLSKMIGHTSGRVIRDIEKCYSNFPSASRVKKLCEALSKSDDYFVTLCGE